ncbi:MAG: hypothetical protein AAFV80_13965, partial [Bacteroidota bacterium]
MKTLRFTILVILALPLLSASLFAQVGINETGDAPHPSAQLDVTSSDKGMLIPRMTTAQKDQIANPADGLLVYDTDTGTFWYFENDQWNEINTKTDLASTIGFEEPAFQDTFIAGGSLQAMAYANGHLFVLDNTTRRMIAFDVTDPTDLTPVGLIDIESSTVFFQDLAISGNYAYIVHKKGTSSGVITVVDISAPANMLFVSQQVDVPVGYSSIDIQDDHLYLADGDNEELIIYNITNPNNGVEVARLGGFSNNNNLDNFEVQTSGDHAYVFHSASPSDGTGRVSVVDISSPSSPSILSHVLTVNVDYGPTGGPFRMGIQGNLLYVCYESGLHKGDIIDISDPFNPTIVGEWGDNTTGYPASFDFYNGLMYSANTNNSGNERFLTTNFSDPANPDLIFNTPLAAANTLDVSDFLIANQHAFVLTLDQIFAFKIADSYIQTIEADGTISLTEAGDNLGNHQATQNISLNDHWISGNGGDEGIFIDYVGDVGINTPFPQATLDVFGSVKAISFTGDGSGLSNVPVAPFDTLFFEDGSFQITALPPSSASPNSVLRSNELGNVVWGPFPFDSDRQKADKFELAGTDLLLSLENDNEPDYGVDLSPLRDNLGNHSATENINLNGHWLNSTGGNDTGLFVDNAGQVGISTGQPGAALDVSGEILMTGSVVDMGLITELETTDPILNLAVNLFTPTVDANRLGGMFRLDSRTSSGNPLFQWIVKPVGQTNVNSSNLLMTLDDPDGLYVNRKIVTRERLMVNVGAQVVSLNSDPFGNIAQLDVGGASHDNDTFVIGDLTNGSNNVIMLGHVG